MKNNFKLITTLVFLAIINLVNAQDVNWRYSHLDKGANYYEIVNAQREKLSILKNKTDIKSKKQIKQFERWADYWRNRIMPDGSFVSSQHIYNEWLKLQESKPSINSDRADATWNFIGPSTPPNSSISYYPGMGRVNAIAFAPNNLNTLYVGAASGGIWKSTDGGTTWVAKGDDLPVMGISDIVIDPNNENILYIATGDYDGQLSFSVGVLKSTDAGETWNMTGLSTELSEVKTISKLLIDPNNSSNILATLKGSIQRTTDAGDTWEEVYSSGGEYLFNDIQYKTGSSTIIYATEQDGTFLKSINNGESWTALTTLGDNFERIDIAQTPNDANLILVLGSQGEIFKSVDEGSNWNKISTVENFQSQGEYNQEIAISPINKDLVIVGGVYGNRSTDGGVTWEKYLDGYWEPGNPYFYVHSDHHEMKFLPNSNTILNGNDGGLFKGDASTNTAWTDLSSGLGITQYYCVSGTPQDANKLILGAQDNDVAFYDGTNFIGQNPGSDGVEGLWDYSNSNIAWSCSQSGILERTMDGFNTTETLNPPAGAPFVWQLEIHPTTPSTIYGGFQDVNISTDRGDNWTSLNSNVVNLIEAIAIAKSDANTIFVSAGNELKRTNNGGTSWTDLTSPQAGIIKGIVVHPTNTDEVYICYSGYSAGRVYKSTDAGANWTDISNGLPNVPCLKIAYKTGDDVLYVATDLGVFSRESNGSVWETLGNGLPNVSVTDLAINYAANKLRVSTLGRGLWEVSLDDENGIEENEMNDSHVSIYPNPTKNKTFNLDLNNLEGNSNVLIYNVVGGVVEYVKTSNSSELVNLSKYPQGIYFVKVTNHGKSLTKKVILK